MNYLLISKFAHFIKDIDLVFWYLKIQDGGRHPIHLKCPYSLHLHI